MSNLVSYEPLVESTISVFLKRTEELFERAGGVCDFPRWLQFFAFDVIGELTWGKRIGFIEDNEDVSGIVAFIARFLEYAGPVSYISEESPIASSRVDGEYRLARCLSSIYC